jgi:UDP-N-acetylmuramoyl-tripeptide--D-alanyl-D-alanine ligase
MAFGFAEGADVRIEPVSGERGAASGKASATSPLAAHRSPLILRTPAGRIETSLQVPGEHNLRNAASAAAAALALGASAQAVAKGLAAYAGTKGRLQTHACILGATLIDDTYNANPDSVLAAVQVLAARPGSRILVLGDMGELGPDAAALHREMGERARAAGIDRLLCLGELSVHAARGFGPGAMHFERIEELLAEVECALGPAVTVLVKGSRFMQMERVVRSFMEANLCQATGSPEPGISPPRGAAESLARSAYESGVPPAGAVNESERGGSQPCS